MTKISFIFKFLIYQLCLITRPSPYIVFTHWCSANREICLSFEERPLTTYPNFTSQFLYRIGYLQTSPTVQKFSVRLFRHSATVTKRFCYIRFLGVKASRIKVHYWLTCVSIRCHPDRLTGLFPHSGRILLHPKGLCFSIQSTLCHRFIVESFSLPDCYH